MCANNYLGLSGDLETQQRPKRSADRKIRLRPVVGALHLRHPDRAQGTGAALSEFLGTEDTILYAAAFDANGGVFEPLFDENDAIISDALNHASIIDGIRLCKAGALPLRQQRHGRPGSAAAGRTAAGKRHKVIVTDGVFSMDGTIAQLDKICDLADKYGALVMIDESPRLRLHGQDRPRHARAPQCDGPIDIITGTLGKALGGAMGGFTSAARK
jgi:glycine C-acetyltransferase